MKGCMILFRVGLGGEGKSPVWGRGLGVKGLARYECMVYREIIF